MRPVYLSKPQQQLTQLIAMYQKHKKIPLLQLSCPVRRDGVPWEMRSPTIYGIHNWPTLQGPQCPTVQVWLYDCTAGWLYLGNGARKELCRCLHTWTHSYKTTECWTEFRSLLWACVRLTEWLAMGQFKTWVQTLPVHITILRSHEQCVMYAVSKMIS